MFCAVAALVNCCIVGFFAAFRAGDCLAAGQTGPTNYYGKHSPCHRQARWARNQALLGYQQVVCRLRASQLLSSQPSNTSWMQCLVVVYLSPVRRYVVEEIQLISIMLSYILVEPTLAYQKQTSNKYEASKSSILV